jgi:hypothetical protein
LKVAAAMAELVDPTNQHTQADGQLPLLYESEGAADHCCCLV